MIIFLAGLLDVPRHLYEAADIEGGSAWQKFRYVTLPMITPVIFFSLVIGVIQAFQYFTQAYVASTTLGWADARSLGAPQNSLLFYTIYLFQQGFSTSGWDTPRRWRGCCSSSRWSARWCLIRTSNRWVHYQGGMFK